MSIILLFAWIITYLPNGRVLIVADEGKYLRQKGDETMDSRVTRVSLPKAELIDEWEEFVVEDEDVEPEDDSKQ